MLIGAFLPVSLPPSLPPSLLPPGALSPPLCLSGAHLPLPAVASPNTQSHCCCLATLAFTSQPLFTSALLPPSLPSLSVWLDEWSCWTVSGTSSAGRAEPLLPVSHHGRFLGPFSSFFFLLSSFFYFGDLGSDPPKFSPVFSRFIGISRSRLGGGGQTPSKDPAASLRTRPRCSGGKLQPLLLHNRPEVSKIPERLSQIPPFPSALRPHQSPLG